MTNHQNMTKDRYASATVRTVFSRMRKLVFHAMLATLGVSSLVTGVQKAGLAANSNAIVQPDSDFSTLSGESLRGIVNRDSSKDYLAIVSETKPPTEREPIRLGHETEVSVVQVPATLLDLINRVDFNTGGSSLDSDQLVKIRYRMDLS
ncbi:MAG TPA: hypothetical protein V6C85_04900 [Allocoleopsis sp.]